MLAVLHLDPQHPAVAGDSRDHCRMHGTVLSMLGMGADRGRYLWAQPRPDRLLVQSPVSVDVRWLPDGYCVHHDVTPTRLDWRIGDRVGWATIANPVTRHSQRRADGTRIRVVRVPRPDADVWARERLSPILGDLTVHVAERRTTAAYKPDGRRITISSARLHGTGTVTDPDRLRDLISQGWGCEKSYGCGLLLVAGSEPR